MNYPASIPDHFHIVIFELLIDGQDAEPFHLRLSNEHPVEWIAVCPRQCAHRAAMFDAHWQPVYPPCGQITLGALFPARRQCEDGLRFTDFDRDLPPKWGC